MSMTLVLCMVLSLTLMTTVSAADWEEHWAAPQLAAAVENGWMTGDPDGSMRPNDYIKRAELAVMLWRALNSPLASGAASFADVPGNPITAAQFPHSSP